MAKPGDKISDLKIGDRLTFGNTIILPATSNLTVSWSINQAGVLSCDIPARDLPTTINRNTLLGKWVEYSHPSAGKWGGVITRVHADAGIYSITAESWAIALRGVLSNKGFRAGPTVGTADLIGSMRDEIEQETPYTGVKVSGRGLQTANVFVASAFFDRGQDLYDVLLPAFTDAFDKDLWRSGIRPFGWNVDPVSRVWYCEQRFGEDLLPIPKFVDGVDINRSTFTEDLTDIYNWVLLEASVATPEVGDLETRFVQARNHPSVGTYGPRAIYIQRNQRYASLAAMQAVAQQQADALASNEQLVTIEVNNDNGAWGKFVEGQLIDVDLSRSRVTGRMFARHRALDVTRGVMVVSGEAELTL